MASFFLLEKLLNVDELGRSGPNDESFSEDRQPLFQISPVNNKIKEPMLQHKFCTLKSARQILADRFADDAGTGKSDH